MRILHISRTMGQGGAEKIVFQLCKDNDQQQQFVISDGGTYVKELEKRGIKHYVMPDINSKNPVKMFQCFWKILQVVRKNKIQVIHSHHRMAAFYARLISSIVNVKCVYTAHNVFFNKRKLLRFALKKTKIVAVGDGVKNNLVNFYGFDSKRITIVYNSINQSGFENGSSILSKMKKINKYLVGTIGRITEQKGIDVFLKAMKEFEQKNRNVIGVVVGDGEDLEKMKKLANDFLISDKIVFLGFKKNILSIIQQLDLVVSASRWEGLPLTPIEVFSQSKTIIATDIVGNNEVVIDRYNGLLFQKNSPTDLVNKLEILISDDSLKKRLEKNAYKTFQEKYRYDHFIDGYNAVYKTLI